MDISILRYVDILVGFALVMALGSSFVTLLTQLVHALEKTRSRLLENGIASLLKRAEPSLIPYADEIAEAVLQWHHVSGGTETSRDVIVREQFIKIILEIVADPSPSIPESGISQPAKDALAKLFIDPTGQLDSAAYAAKLIESIDRNICELETNNQGLASYAIHTRAIVEAKAGKFVDALMTRFDNMSDSLSALFTTHSHRVTFLLSLLIALSLPLDTIDLLQRLSSDDTLKNVLVTEALKQTDMHVQTVAPDATSPKTDLQKPNGQSTSQSTQVQANSNDALANIDFEAINNAFRQLNDPQLSLISRGGWDNILKFDQPSLNYYLEFIFGCFLTALLLSIGAPFWFESLKNLINLRSNLAKTDDTAREFRRNDQAKTPVNTDDGSKAS